MKELYDIYNMLYISYGMQYWWPADSVFEMMVGAILTQNTSWSNVERALNNFGSNLTPDYIINCQMEELCAIIRPSGFFNQKAPRLKSLAQWFKKYNYDIEQIKSENHEKIRNELLQINGVGYETADSIMLYAFDKPYLVIDAYTIRIFTRLGFDLPKDYESIRNYFENRLPYRNALFNEFHALVVKHAKLFCKTKPACEECSLKGVCSFHDTLDKSTAML